MSATKSGLIEKFMLGGLWLYKRSLSAVFYFFGARCRHMPSCSEYASLAITRHGAWVGFWLMVSRLLRCHPFGSSGFDPPPNTRDGPWWRIDRLGDWTWTERGDAEESKSGR